MKKLTIIAAVAALHLNGCAEDAAPPAADRAAQAGPREAGEGETVIRADDNGAFIDTPAGEIRFDRNGLDVDLDGREIEAKIRTGKNLSVSIDTNRQ
ncbi:hypothetical protein [Sphingosinicella sp. CPCC 101087]|uniref:hypothetical protein n=1 Tax=Sphingosinicella sp. CPCC 101087 TaxID=2497754 RepID=UPI00101D23D5|nr:hypothetical protein [Sphingosinicella sp. CPCC 101087]